MTQHTAYELLNALELLYLENVDYITINHLGDPHHNKSMQMARDALRRARFELYDDLLKGRVRNVEKWQLMSSTQSLS